MIRLIHAISDLATDAAMRKRPSPVIYTDVFSGMLLRRMIHEDLGFALPMQDDCFCMFDGVKVMKLPEPYAEWHNHFGVLAEAFGDVA